MGKQAGRSEEEGGDAFVRLSVAIESRAFWSEKEKEHGTKLRKKGATSISTPVFRLKRSSQ